MSKELWKIKKCWEQVTIRFTDDGIYYKMQPCGKPPTYKVQQYDYFFYVCDEHKDLYPHCFPIEETKIISKSSDFLPKQRWQIMERDGHKCVKCGRTAEDGIKLHVDHIFPKSRGGMATLENGQTLCNECNIGKGARVPLLQTVGASV